jgi:regulation of enolase protein 1 (concanavalin A-like superfamily)
LTDSQNNIRKVVMKKTTLFKSTLCLCIIVLALLMAVGSVSAAVEGFDQSADWGGIDFPPQRGVNKVSGSVLFSDGVYTIKGNGDDIWETNDEGFFVYKELEGSQQMTARVTWIDPNDSGWSKVGIMMRENGADPSSRHYWVMLRGMAFGDQIGAQWRLTTGGDSDWSEILPANDSNGHVTADANASIWFRLTRIAETGLVITEWSYDGAAWNKGHVMALDLPDSIAWGMSITNHLDNDGLAVAQVSNVSFSKPSLVVGSRTVDGPGYFNSPELFKVGDEFDVTVKLTSTSDHDMTTDVSEMVPDGWDVSGISDGGTENGGAIIWSGVKVASGSEISVSYKLTAPIDSAAIISISGTVGDLDIGGPSLFSLIGGQVGDFESQVDIGAAAIPGTATFDGDEYIIEGSGADIEGSADQMHFLFSEVSGSFVIEGNVYLEGVHDWSKAGLMVRDDITVDSQNYFAMVNTIDQGVRAQYRPADGAATDYGASFFDHEGNIRIERIGTQVTLSYQTFDDLDAGADVWTKLASYTTTMTDPVYAGLAITSHDNTLLAGAYFQDVTITVLDPVNISEWALY